MRRGARLFLRLLAVAGLSSLWAPEASAYVDPGVGSCFFQLLIAAAIGGLFAAKTFLRTVATFFGDRFGGRAPGRPAKRAADPRDPT
jgi:hypothetical protein